MAQLTQIAPTGSSGFDAHHPPPRELIADCVHCGFCLPACPTHVLSGQEMDSPRGRIYMMKQVSEGNAQQNETLQLHIDNCLGCMACMTACPSGVDYSKLLEDTRAQIERNVPRSLTDKLFRRLLFAVFPYPRRLRLLAAPMFLYQRSGLQRLLRSVGLIKLLPERLQSLEALTPPLRSMLNRQPGTPVKLKNARTRVGMLAGCVQQVFFNHVNQATLRVLAAEGCDVVIPASNACCGALMVHSGMDDDAMRMVRHLIASFELAYVETVVINSAGCGSTMKQYGYLLRDDPQWADRAARFSAKCRDISEVLSSLEPHSARHPLPMRIAYHDACHLRHAQGVFAEPRAVLNSIPGLEILEIPEPDMCCGSAGVYNLLRPQTARELGDRKVSSLLAMQVGAIVSANPGCLLQLMNGLRRRGLGEMPTFHMVELLDASIRNLSPEELLKERGLSATSKEAGA